MKLLTDVEMYDFHSSLGYRGNMLENSYKQNASWLGQKQHFIIHLFRGYNKTLSDLFRLTATLQYSSREKCCFFMSHSSNQEIHKMAFSLPVLLKLAERNSQRELPHRSSLKCCIVYCRGNLQFRRMCARLLREHRPNVVIILVFTCWASETTGAEFGLVLHHLFLYLLRRQVSSEKKEGESCSLVARYVTDSLPYTHLSSHSKSTLEDRIT